MTLLTTYQEEFPPCFPNPPVSSLLLRDNGRKFDDLTPLDSDRPLFRIQHSFNPFCSKPNVAILDTSTNAIVATVMLHIFTSKASITLTTPNISSSFTYKKKFRSFAPGLGDLTWNFVGPDSDFNMQLTNSEGEVIATYAGNGDLKGAEKRLDVWREKLPPAAMDEIIVTLVARIERLRKEMEIRFVDVPVVVTSAVAPAVKTVCV